MSLLYRNPFAFNRPFAELLALQSEQKALNKAAPAAASKTTPAPNPKRKPCTYEPKCNCPDNLKALQARAPHIADKVRHALAGKDEWMKELLSLERQLKADLASLRADEKEFKRGIKHAEREIVGMRWKLSHLQARNAGRGGFILFKFGRLVALEREIWGGAGRAQGVEEFRRRKREMHEKYDERREEINERYRQQVLRGRETQGVPVLKAFIWEDDGGKGLVSQAYV
ncbi:hypothetical protein QBC34DRAFT_166314 [Podospora aff. communis PSN243]|uniref:Uncharacterized protein n=1 Tax=Podospora aff. communis PSN243 TaxID=3040156 RepID=A0AAV9GC33_9PEZI|nr:hypothetical protein QBC34DRAFT_166314 [Podospora aff. communis PSN243]